MDDFEEPSKYCKRPLKIKDGRVSVNNIEAVLKSIAEQADDDEVAHSYEDHLRHEVLKAIASGAPNAADLAKAVLKSSDIEFARWCA